MDLEFQENNNIVHLSGMYENWFLDYASYVILERAVPHIHDGLKPVQRRILHSLKEMHDGRYHKVANVIGHTMKYHPHGDASIGDAMVQIGQKELLLDMQGNWGNIYTGDKSAAARYIEVRLTQFALDVVFNNKITDWSSSYDGRGKEPKILPVKFPLLLIQGVEGIAVGLSTKILPHNFNELIDASIKVLKGVKPRIYPDFITGGTADFSDYNDGRRGGKIRVRAKIIQKDKTTLKIIELPFTTTTSSLISSILKANDKGKIKIKKVEDNTAENVEILVQIPSGISPEKTIDALYRFTDCEVSISPIGCVIENNEPKFIGVSEILQKSTQNTLKILEKELRFNLNELEAKWHNLSLERIFIENRIYHKIEELDNWDDIIKTIHKSLLPFVNILKREINDDDIERLTEIKIKKITKYDLNKVNDDLSRLEIKVKDTKYNIDNLNEYAINYFLEIKKKHGVNKFRKTEIKAFENIDATKVVVASKKLYINRKEGFIGTSMRKDEFVCDCSDIDDIIIFNENGSMKVVKVDNKVFVGKDIIHCAVFNKRDDRTIYNLIYKDSKTGNSMIKRFNVISITRNKIYQLTKSDKDKILYFTANANGEAEVVTINLRKLQKLRVLRYDIDFADITIKGKTAVGNIVSKNPVKNIELKSEGLSTLSARKIWFDDNVNRLNTDERGGFLGDFKAEDKILTINQNAFIELKSFDISNHFDDDIIILEKLDTKKPISIIYFDGEKKLFFVKRFLIESNLKRTCIISNHKYSYLEVVSTDFHPRVEVVFVKEKGKERKKEIINLSEFIAIKGIKTLGNQLSSKKIKEINLLSSLDHQNIDINNKNINANKSDLNTNNDEGQITLNL
tara:strand:+ start:87221 stop:89782 length:2562 start_codon:yes stop_codon:yes gene_type:complete